MLTDTGQVVRRYADDYAYDYCPAHGGYFPTGDFYYYY